MLVSAGCWKNSCSTTTPIRYVSERYYWREIFPGSRILSSTFGCLPCLNWPLSRSIDLNSSIQGQLLTVWWIVRVLERKDLEDKWQEGLGVRYTEGPLTMGRELKIIVLWENAHQRTLCNHENILCRHTTTGNTINQSPSCCPLTLTTAPGLVHTSHGLLPENDWEWQAY